MSADSWSHCDRLLVWPRTTDRLTGNLAGTWAGGGTRLTEDQLDDLEDALILSDLGPRAAARIRANWPPPALNAAPTRPRSGRPWRAKSPPSCARWPSRWK
jgi:hypothetical protein